MRTKLLPLRVVTVLGCVFAFAASADWSAPPPADTFVLDRAELLTPEEEAAIEAQCAHPIRGCSPACCTED